MPLDALNRDLDPSRQMNHNQTILYQIDDVRDRSVFQCPSEPALRASWRHWVCASIDDCLPLPTAQHTLDLVACKAIIVIVKSSLRPHLGLYIRSSSAGWVVPFPCRTGQYGTAWKARSRANGQIVCLKRIPLNSKDDHKGALQEAQVGSSETCIAAVWHSTAPTGTDLTQHVYKPSADSNPVKCSCYLGLSIPTSSLMWTVSWTVRELCA